MTAEWEDFLHENYDDDGVAQSQLERATYAIDYHIDGWENWRVYNSEEEG